MADTAKPAPKPVDVKPSTVKPAPTIVPAAAKPKPAAPAPVKAAAPVTTKPASALAKAAPEPDAKKPDSVKQAKPAAAKPQTKPIAAKPAITLAAKDKTMNDTIKNITDKAQTMFAEGNDRAKGTWDKSARAFEDMNGFAKGNMEAMVESSKIAAKGFETMGQDAAAFAKKSYEDATAAMKSFAAVKSPTELMKLQSDYFRASFDALVAETSRSTEKAMKLAGEIAQPLSNRTAVAVEKVKVAA